MRLIDAEPIEKFIEAGLNEIDPIKNFGHDGIEILTEIHYAPTIDAALVVHAYWITHNADNPFLVYGECSACGFQQSMSDKLNYCPCCGARMDEQNEY